MIKYYKTIDGKLTELERFEDSIWVRVVAPTEKEIDILSQELGLHVDEIKAALDNEERPRLEVDGNEGLIVLRTPIINRESKHMLYDTVPLVIYLVKDCILTISTLELPMMNDFSTGKVKNFFTYMKTRFILQILLRNANYFLAYLQQIDHLSENLENILHSSTKNTELIKLLNLEKSLVYFSTSLKGNDVVLEKITKHDAIKKYPDDQFLLEDTITETKQAIDMANIYSNILSSTMDAFASIISNNQNVIIKILTAATIVLTIPTLISSFYGMNVPVPGEGSDLSFWIILLISLVLAGALTWVMRKRRWF